MIQTDVVPIGSVFFSDILENGIEAGVFEIPPIQRHYQWGIGDKNNEEKNRSAKELIDDLLNFFTLNQSNEIPYFVGTIIIYQDENAAAGVFQLMDGQQRWTTYTALMGVIYNLFDRDQTGTHDWSDVKADIRNRFLQSEEHDHRLRSHRDYDDEFIKLLSTMDGGTDLSNWEPASQDAPVVEFTPENTKFSGTNLYCVARFFQQYLSEHFSINGPFSSRESLHEFYLTIKDRIIVNLTLAPSSTVAYEMFITANARGTPLNNFDIFRGLIITREMELALNVSEKLRRMLQSTQTKLDQLVAIKKGKDPNSVIDNIISQICGVVEGQRVEKTTVMFYLKKQMADLTTEAQLLRYCRFVLQYCTITKYLEDRLYFGGDWEFVRLNFIGFSGHLPIYTTAAIKAYYDEAEEDLVDRLMAGIESLIMRCALTQDVRKATLFFWENSPKIANRIYRNGLSAPLVNNLLEELADSRANPENLTWLGLEGAIWPIPSSMKRKELISAFYALEGLTNGPYGGGPGSGSTRLITPLMPTFDFSKYVELVSAWDYGEEALGREFTSRTIGNLFLLT